MELVVNKLYDIQSSSNINVESVAEDLVLVNLELTLDSYKFDKFKTRPLHCLYYFGDFPPLDISFDSETGLLKEITFFTDKSSLKHENIIGNVEYQNVIGYPCFNTEFAEKHESYYTETCEIIITLRELSLSVARTNRLSSKKVIVNENLSILLDEKEALTGVEINNICKDSLNLFK
jgi:hypothetical protein